MSTDLTDIFGDEITVHAQNRKVDQQLSGNAGSHGLTSMNLGSRGYDLVVKGTLRESGESYDAARAELQAVLDDEVEPLLWADADTYEFRGETWENIIWLDIQLIPDGNGVMFHYTSAGQMTVNFIALGKALI